MNPNLPLRTVLAPNPSPMTLDGTHTYIVGQRDPIVVDPGPAIEDHIVRVLTTLDGAVPRAIVITHTHDDHSGAAVELASRSGGPLWVGHPPPALEPLASAVQRVASGGETLHCDAGNLELLRTPGHAPEHLALWWTGGAAPAGGALFVGDLMMGHGDTTLVSPPDGDLADYLASLDEVERLAPAVIYPAHGPPIEDPGAAIARYRAHRKGRIEQVEQLLAMDPGVEVEALVDLVYGEDLDPRLRPAARGSINALVYYVRQLR